MLLVMAAVDRAEIDIAAPPALVWDLVTDLDRMGDWSPECYRCTWMDGGTGPRVGARFKGWNRQDLGPIPVKWTTVSTVTESKRGEVFAFTTKQSGATWAYTFAPTPDGGTRVVETRTDGEKPLVAKVFHKVMPGRDEILTDGMKATLERVKAAAEST
jgi:uncharacterized protein YndB with AHSA1/START domain